MFPPIPIYKSIHPSVYVGGREREGKRGIEKELWCRCVTVCVALATRERLTHLHQAAGAPG